MASLTYQVRYGRAGIGTVQTYHWQSVTLTAACFLRTLSKETCHLCEYPFHASIPPPRNLQSAGWKSGGDHVRRARRSIDRHLHRPRHRDFSKSAHFNVRGAPVESPASLLSIFLVLGRHLWRESCCPSVLALTCHRYPSKGFLKVFVGRAGGESGMS